MGKNRASIRARTQDPRHEGSSESIRNRAVRLAEKYGTETNAKIVQAHPNSPRFLIVVHDSPRIQPNSF
eukprot:scaffold372496_cov17-Prasinocladus_malaysianus.AAC.1